MLLHSLAAASLARRCFTRSPHHSPAAASLARRRFTCSPLLHSLAAASLTASLARRRFTRSPLLTRSLAATSLARSPLHSLAVALHSLAATSLACRRFTRSPPLHPLHSLASASLSLAFITTRCLCFLSVWLSRHDRPLRSIQPLTRSWVCPSRVEKKSVFFFQRPPEGKTRLCLASRFVWRGMGKGLHVGGADRLAALGLSARAGAFGGVSQPIDPGVRVCLCGDRWEV
jgi:hypothetical protein